VTCRLRPDKELPEALLLGPHWGDDLGGAHPRRDDLRGARSRRPIILRSASGEREAGRGSGKRGWREREERGAAVVHAEGEPREEDERDEDPAERPHQLLGMPELVRRGGGPDLVGAWTPERITFFSERGRGLLGEEGDRKRDMRGGFPEAEIVCSQPHLPLQSLHPSRLFRIQRPIAPAPLRSSLSWTPGRRLSIAGKETTGGGWRKSSLSKFCNSEIFL
jgi:hypothetical protein